MLRKDTMANLQLLVCYSFLGADLPAQAQQKTPPLRGQATHFERCHSRFSEISQGRIGPFFALGSGGGRIVISAWWATTTVEVVETADRKEGHTIHRSAASPGSRLFARVQQAIFVASPRRQSSSSMTGPSFDLNHFHRLPTTMWTISVYGRARRRNASLRRNFGDEGNAGHWNG